MLVLVTVALILLLCKLINLINKLNLIFSNFNIGNTVCVLNGFLKYNLNTLYNIHCH